MKGSALAIGTMVVGLILTAAGPLAVALLPAGVYWSEEDHEAYQKAAADFHAATYVEADHNSPAHTHELPADAEGKAKLEAFRQEYQRQEARLKAAQSSRGWLGIGLRGIGVLLAAAGVLLFVRARQKGP